MTIAAGPDISTSGLIFHLDAADANNSLNGLDIEYLIVGGGGGGGPAFNVHACGAGGGAGAFRNDRLKVTASSSYSIVVGAGGVRTTTTVCGRSANGNDSSAFGSTSNGGAGGGTWCNTVSGSVMVGTSNGNASGSGAGGAGGDNGTGNLGGSGGDYGNNGGSQAGTGNSNGTTSCGGGGGAGGPGANGTSNSTGGDGGIGSFSNISGNGSYYAGGGAGGSTRGNSGGGGLGGGGNRGNPPGGHYPSGAGENGLANTGGGGGGASGGSTTAYGGSGGSGIVIIRYRGPQKATGGNSIYSNNGYTVHVFTSSGTFNISNITIDDLSPQNALGSFINMSDTNYVSNNLGYFTFDGTNERIDTGTSFESSISGVNNFSICCWVYPQNTQPNYADIWGNHSNYKGIVCQQNNNIVNQYSWGWGTGSSWAFGSGAWNMSAQSWTYLACVRDGSDMITYANAKVVADNAVGSSSILPNTTFNFQIATGYDLNSSRYFRGNISNFQVYNRALNYNEILQNYIANKGRYGL